MFLPDTEILNIVRAGHIKNTADPLLDAFGQRAQVQPSSIDLRIGQIYTPGSLVNESGGKNNPLADYLLPAGGTAIVPTIEHFDLPPSIAGFGFPPAHISMNGLLMTNPGHIDPGYKGP